MLNNDNNGNNEYFQINKNNGFRIYFAHCKNDYGSDIEKAVIKLIDQMGVAVNPSDKEFQNTCVRSSMSYWFGVVRSCKMLVFMRYKGHITAGAGQEIETAFQEEIPVFEVKKTEEGYDFTRHEELPEYLDLEATRMLMYPEKYMKECQK